MVKELVLRTTDLRNHLRKAVESVRYDNHRIGVIRHGELYAVLVSPEDYEFLQRYRPAGNDKQGPRPAEDLISTEEVERKRLAREEAERKAAKAAQKAAEAKEREREEKLFYYPEYLPADEVVQIYHETNQREDALAERWRVRAWWMLKELGRHHEVQSPFKMPRANYGTSQAPTQKGTATG